MEPPMMMTRLKLSEGSRVLVDGGPDIHQRSDGDQRNLARVAANLFEEKKRRHSVRRFGKMAGFGVATLGERGLGRRGRASRHGYLRRPTSARKRSRSFARVSVVPEGSCDADDLQFGAAQSEREREGIVDVVADIVSRITFRGGRELEKIAVAGG